MDGADVRDLPPMVPWFKGYKGSIENLDNQRYVVNGEIAEISDTKLEITELPIRTWTQNYKESVMEAYLNGSEKQPALIQDFKEYHTDVTVKFVVQMAADKLRSAELSKGLHQFFKLQTTLSTSSMVLFDHLGVLRRFENVNEILQEFYHVRLDYYARRKTFLEGMLGAEAQKLSNQARFIIEKCDGSLVVENKKKKAMIAELQRKNFDPDPVKRWKKTQEEQTESGDESDSDLEEDVKDADYDYLLGMAMWNLTLEKKEELLRKKNEKHQELELLKRTSKSDLWRNDLKEFSKKLDEFEEQQAEEERQQAAKAQNKKDRGFKGKKVKIEVMPSPHGIRVVPKIPEEMRKKAAAAAAAKDRKGKGVPKKSAVEEEKDEFDMMIDDKDLNTSLSEKLGFEKKPSAGAKKPAKKPAAASAKKSGRNPWESASGSESGSESDLETKPAGGKGSDVEYDISDYGAPARDRPGRQRKTVNYNFDKSSSGSDSGSDEELKDNAGVKEEPQKNGTAAKRTLAADSDSDSDAFGSSTKRVKADPPPKAKEVSDDEDNDSKFDNLFGSSANGKNGHADKKKSAFDSDSDVDAEPPPKKKATKYKEDDSEDDFKPSEDSDDDFAPKKAKKKAPAAAKKPAASKKPAKKPAATALAKKKNKFSDSDDDEDDIVAASPPPPAKPKKTKKLFSVSDDDDDFGTTAAASKKPKPAKKKAPAAPVEKKKSKKKTSFGSDSSNDEMDFSGIKDYAPAGDRPGRQKKTVNYNFNYDSDSDGDF